MGEANLPNVISTEGAPSNGSLPVTSGPFYAYRMVFPVKAASGKYWVTIMLVESYPTAGRVWTRTLNPDSVQWGAWKLASAQ